MSNEFKKKVKKTAELIANSEHLVFFTGAGISTESGIPDYRGPNGVWTRRDKGLPPPRVKKPWNEIGPNEGHMAIVELQNMGLLKFLISQNVDNLHLTSGIDKDKIGEFHGNKALMKCLNCGSEYKKAEIWDERKWGPGYLTSKQIKGQPVCPECNGRIVSTIVNFGDPIPETVLEDSMYHSSNSDVFIVVGSSLLVTPAANMPKYALKNGAKLIIINRQETPFDRRADILFHTDAGKTLTAILEEVKAIQSES